MTDRNNEARLGDKPNERADLPLENSTKPLSFAAPTEMVELPSGGKLYPEGHPLHGVESVEIRFMTAKEEDILTSRSLIKNGLVLDRLLESVLVDPRVRPDDMLIGDKNALLIAARVTGYGSNYDTKVVCPACGERSDYSFDLDHAKVVKGGDTENAHGTENGTWLIKLPKSGWNVEVRLLIGRDEKRLADIMQSKRKNNLPENSITEQLKAIIVSVEGQRDMSTILQVIDNMPAVDAKYLREEYAKVSPNVDLTQNFKCSKCDEEMLMEVPLNTDFFWTR